MCLKNVNITKIIFIILSTSFCLIACSDEEISVGLDPGQEYEFLGNYSTIDSEEIPTGEVYLIIKRGSYVCTTDLPFGIGAGREIIELSTIEFVDTLFFQFRQFMDRQMF